MTDTTAGDGRFDFGHVVGQTFGLIGRNFFAFAALAILLVGAPQFAITYLETMLRDDGSPLFAWVPLASFVVTLVTSYILQGALTRASVDDLSKKGVSIGAALGDGLRYMFPLFIVALLTGLGVIVGLVFFIIPGLFLMVRWVVSAPAAVIEREGPTHSIGRSADLTRGHRWAVFGLVLLYFGFYYAIALGLGIVVAAIGGAGAQASAIMPRDSAIYIYAFVSAVIVALASLVGTVGMASLYFELRRAKEGIGIDELAKVFE